MKPVRALFTLICCVICVPPAEAQVSAITGERVRLTVQVAPGSPRSQLTGTVLHVSADTVQVDADGQTRNIPRSFVKYMEVSTMTKRNAGRGAFIGMAAGSLALGGILATTFDGCGGSSFCFEPTRAEGFVIGALLGGLSGATLGALIGYGIRSDVWVPTSLTPLISAAPSSDGIRPTLTLRLAF